MFKEKKVEGEAKLGETKINDGINNWHYNLVL